MNDKIKSLLSEIDLAFKDVTLGAGVSWHEAVVIDDYGTESERLKARSKDEHEDWNKVPFKLIGDVRYGSVLPFLDAEGLRFYLPVLMKFALQEHKDADVIVDCLMYSLERKSTVEKLRFILSKEQEEVVVKFLQICLQDLSDFIDVRGTQKALEKLWRLE